MKHSALKITLCALIMLLLVASVGCAATDSAPEAQEELTQEAVPTNETTQAPTPAGPEALLLTLEELSEYDGQDGRPAYIAVEGVVYDVSIVTAWMGGKHQGYFAGQDVTEKIKEISPHGVRVLSKLPEVGKLKE